MRSIISAFIATGVLCICTPAITSAQNITAIPSFRNHVLPALTKAGCNGGACHGAAIGKGGLKLTLRGYDPQWDYNVLTRQAAGRRVSHGHPSESLLLLKASNLVGHGGGERIKKGSADFKLIEKWIAAGAPGPSSSDPSVVGLEVSPDKAILPMGASRQLVVKARYSTGKTEDVTRWTKFGTNAGQIASVDDQGNVKALANGEAAITIWFNSKVAFARALSPFPGDGAEISRKSEKLNFIDQLVGAKLEALNIPTSGLCNDNQFIRRAYLDAMGILPTADEVAKFSAEIAPQKRTQLIEAILKRPEFVDYWTYRWSDLFLVSSKRLAGSALNSFYGWLRTAVEENRSWDKIARQVITATGSNLDNGAVNYYLLHRDPIDLTETTTQAFLGMSVQCARCHNHPMEKWTLNEYYQMANLFSRVRLKNGDRAGEVLAIPTPDGNINQPRLGKPLPPKPLDGKEISLVSTIDRRQALADWLTVPENPYFSRAIVNRVWRTLMGKGIVEAEDDLRLTNPPSNQELMDGVSSDFSQHGFDLRHLIKTIMTSAAYQRSSEPAGVNAKDDRLFSRYYVRRLSAEVMLDAISQVSGVPTEFAGYAKGTRSLQLRDSQVGSYFLTAFGRPERQQTCACERQQEPNVAQALHLVNGDTLNMKLRSAGGTVDRFLKTSLSDSQVVEQLYLTALSRPPTSSESAKMESALADSSGATSDKDRMEARRRALEDIIWALLTHREFLFGH